MLFLSETTQSATRTHFGLNQNSFKVDVLFTEVIDDAPVGLGHSEPFTVARTNVDVDRAEVVVLLVTWDKLGLLKALGGQQNIRVCPGSTWSPAPWHLHVQLDGVHAQNGVAQMAQQVPG